MDRFIRVYDAKRDKRGAKTSRRTTLETEGGLDHLNGMLCRSPEWFQAIDAGQIEKHELEGEIAEASTSEERGNFPTFKIRTADKLWSWPTYGTTSLLGRLLYNRLYKAGNKVRMAYVRHPWKPSTVTGGDSHMNVVLFVDICQQ